MQKKESSELQAKLKKADPIVKKYIAELEKRNAKRQRDIVNLKADNTEQDGRIKALEQNRPSAQIDPELLGSAKELLKEFKKKKS